jgi:hypothetical protein
MASIMVKVRIWVCDRVNVSPRVRVQVHVYLRILFALS